MRLYLSVSHLAHSGCLLLLLLPHLLRHHAIVSRENTQCLAIECTTKTTTMQSLDSTRTPPNTMECHSIWHITLHRRSFVRSFSRLLACSIVCERGDTFCTAAVSHLYLAPTCKYYLLTHQVSGRDFECAHSRILKTVRFGFQVSADGARNGNCFVPVKILSRFQRHHRSLLARRRRRRQRSCKFTWPERRTHDWSVRWLLVSEPTVAQLAASQRRRKNHAC